MTINIEKVKVILEKHTPVIEEHWLHCEFECDGYSCNNCEPMYEIVTDAYISQSTTKELAWENIMFYFYDDKSLTGARIADIFSAVSKYSDVSIYEKDDGYAAVVCYEPYGPTTSHEVWGTSVDEAVATLHRKVFLEEE